LLESTAQEMATAFGVPVENIMAAISTGDVDNVTAYLEETDRTREIARAGVFGTGTYGQQQAYLDENASSLVQDAKFREILMKATNMDTADIAMMQRYGTGYEQMLRNAAEEGNLPAIMQEYLSTVGDDNDQSLAALNAIKEAVEGVAPMVSIEGEPATRVSQNGSEYSFTISVAPISTGG